MALRLRRGTDSERQLITPAAGELIYTTDTKLLYVGDGTTAGGTTAGAATTLNALNDTDLTGKSNGDVLQWNSTSSRWEAASKDGVVEGSNYRISILADDSTVVFNSATGLVAAEQVSGTFTGNVVGSLDGVVGATTPAVGSFTNLEADTINGDVTGSLFTDDSTLVVDGINGSMHASSFIPNGNIIEVSSISAATSVKQQIISLDLDSELILTRKSASDLSASSATLGTISFGVEDSNGAKSGAIILGNRNSLYLMADGAGAFSDAALAVTLTDGKLAVGSFGPATEKLDVVGNIKASGSIQPGVYADNTARDAAITSPVAGMIVFNTTGTKFQGYTGSAWADLN